MKESELAEKFIEYFNDGYEVYPEVPAGGGVVDFVATDGTIQIGCEVKTSFNLKLIEQGFRKARNFHYLYICVPLRKDYHFRQIICKRFGIGVLTLNAYGNILEDVKPDLNRKAYTPELKEYMKLSSAGTQSDRVTAFGWTVKQIERYLRMHGPSRADTVLKNIDYHYKTFSSAKSSVRKWIRTGVITTVQWDKGVLKLREDDT